MQFVIFLGSILEHGIGADIDKVKLLAPTINGKTSMEFHSAVGIVDAL